MTKLTNLTIKNDTMTVDVDVDVTIPRSLRLKVLALRLSPILLNLVLAVLTVAAAIAVAQLASSEPLMWQIMASFNCFNTHLVVLLAVAGYAAVVICDHAWRSGLTVVGLVGIIIGSIVAFIRGHTESYTVVEWYMDTIFLAGILSVYVGRWYMLYIGQKVIEIQKNFMMQEAQRVIEEEGILDKIQEAKAEAAR